MIVFETLSETRQDELHAKWETWFDEHGYDYHYESGAYYEGDMPDSEQSFRDWLKRVHDIKY